MVLYKPSCVARKNQKWVDGMNDFQMFINSIGDPDKRERMEGILNDLKQTFPRLKEEIKWNH